jgi:hypothetical protein
MSRQTLSLRDLATGRDIDIEAFCERCGAPLGPYVAGLRYPHRDIVIISERGAITRTEIDAIGAIKRDAAQLGQSTLGVRGPRTQPGLYEESFGGRRYLRKRCNCGANDKRRLENLGELPLTIRPTGVFAVVF